MLIQRRNFLAGLFCAPAIIPINHLMKLMPQPKIITIWDQLDGPDMNGFYRFTLNYAVSNGIGKMEWKQISAAG